MTEMQTRKDYNDGDIPEAKLVDDRTKFNPQSDAPPPTYAAAMAELSGEAGGAGGSGGYVAQCNKLVRLGFLRKVYGILTIQLFTTGAICAIAMRAEGPMVNGFHTLSIGSTLVGSRALYWCIFALSLVLLFALFCYKNKYPANMMLLSMWTISLALTVATSCTIATCDPLVTDGTAAGARPLSVAALTRQSSLYEGRIVCALGTAQADDGTQAVITAGFLTMGLFLSLTLFTFQSRWDFSFLGAGLGMSLFLLIIWSIVMSIFGMGSSYLFALAGTVIFSLYICYDTYRLIHVYTPDDAVMAAIDLYLDCINLFLMILTLLRSEN